MRSTFFAFATLSFWVSMVVYTSWLSSKNRIVNLRSPVTGPSVSNAKNPDVDVPVRSILAEANPPEPKPLATLFTTFKESPERTWIQTNTILNWELLLPEVQPLLFAPDTSSPLSKVAQEHGWLVLPAQGSNKFGTPFLKDMYAAATNFTNSTFYAYSNADILFTESFVDTLQAVHAKYPQNTTLIIGRRVNVIKNCTTNEPPFYEPEEILDFAAKNGKLYRSDAEDYFAIGNNAAFPWSSIKDVVIGRPAYDNYLVGMACQNQVNVIDATGTIRAIHLSEGTKRFSGANNKDGRYNFKVIGKFPWGSGMTGSVPLFTKKHHDGKIAIVKRKKRC